MKDIEHVALNPLDRSGVGKMIRVIRVNGFFSHFTQNTLQERVLPPKNGDFSEISTVLNTSKYKKVNLSYSDITGMYICKKS